MARVERDVQDCRKKDEKSVFCPGNTIISDLREDDAKKRFNNG